MDKATCGFCHRGPSEELEKMCGKLHIEKVDGKIIAAHHKCLQYSAQLVQYKFDNFGGFKLEKVKEEMHRGKFMKCTICRAKYKGKKTKDGHSLNGATAGCALKTCKKTFHFPCAHTDDTAITKRMLIKYKETSKEVVMYRVFCCPDHERKFRTNKSELFLPFQSGKTSSSEDEDNEDTDAKDESDEENTDSDKEGNNNNVDGAGGEKEFQNFLNDISIMTVCSPAVTKSSKKSSTHSVTSENSSIKKGKKLDKNGKKITEVGKNKAMFDDTDEEIDDENDNISLQLNALYDNWGNSDEEEPKTDMTDKQGTSRNSRKSLADTPNSIKVKAQINHVSKSSENKSSVRLRNGSSNLKRSVNGQSSDDEIRPAPEVKTRPSRKCTKNTTSSSQTKDYEHTAENTAKSVKRPLNYSSDSTEDEFVSEKDLRKRHKKFVKSVEKRKKEFDLDDSAEEENSSNLNNHTVKKDKEVSLLGKQTVSNVKPSDAKDDNPVVDLEITGTSAGGKTKTAVKNLSVILDRIDSKKSEVVADKDDNENDDETTDEEWNNSKRSDKTLKRLGSAENNSQVKKPRLNGNNTGKTENQLLQSANCYLNLESTSDTCGSSAESEIESCRYNTCGLILTQDLECSESIRKELLKESEEELGIKQEDIAFWLDAFKLDNLQKEIMPHLMNDIGQKLCHDEGDRGKIANLLTTADKLHSQLPNYSYVLNLYKSMDKSLVQNMQENMFKQLRNSLNNASKKFGYTVGKLLTVQKMNALVLTVNNKLDPKGQIRRKMSPLSSDSLFICSSTSSFPKQNKMSKLQIDEEKSKVLRFVHEKFDDSFDLQIVPSDSILLSTDVKNSSVKTIADCLNIVTSNKQDNENHVLCVCPVDTQIVKYSAFCKKLLAQFVWDNLENKNSQIIAILHLDESIEKVDNFISAIVIEEQELHILTTSNPKDSPVSCAIVTNVQFNEKVKKNEKKTIAGTEKLPNLPPIRITKEVTQVVRSSPRKPSKTTGDS